MTTYHSHKVNLSEGQIKKLSTAHNNKSGITIRLSKSDLTGKYDSLMLTKRQINKLNRAKKSGVGSDLKISQTQTRKVINVGQGAPRMGRIQNMDPGPWTTPVGPVHGPPCGPWTWSMDRVHGPLSWTWSMDHPWA